MAERDVKILNAPQTGLSARLRNRYAVRASGWRVPVVDFATSPEPRTLGSLKRGSDLVEGVFTFAGQRVEAPGQSIWALSAPTSGFDAERHGFAWLDDLAALGSIAAERLASDWVAGWIMRYGRGKGPGWMPDLAGRRVMRWINHAHFCGAIRDDRLGKPFLRSLAHQIRYLARRWHATSPGVARFEALTGQIYAGLALTDMTRYVSPAVEAMADECSRSVDADGGIASRNPEELLEVFTLLTWAAAGLSEAGLKPMRDHVLAIERIAPTLRALRHSDGGLARFHGGGRGFDGKLDHALAASGVRATSTTGLAMGYARMAAGRTSLIVDAGPPPALRVSENAHASTLAFEVTSGRRPLIVNAGSGTSFGADWALAGRATSLHSTLAIEGFSSSRLGSRKLRAGGEATLLLDAPGKVRAQQSEGDDGQSLLVSHNGYVRTHGLTHVRRLDLSVDGREIKGEDTLGALSDRERQQHTRYLQHTKLSAVPFHIHFHVHPDVAVELDMGGRAISLALKSGEIWVFRNTSEARMHLQSGVYLEKGRVEPRATRQIVLSAEVHDHAGQVSWILAKAQDTPSNIRDFGRDTGWN